MGIDLALGTVISGWYGTTGQPPPSFFSVLYVSYTVVSSIVGGYVTAFLARHFEIRHALALGSIACLLSLRPVVSSWNKGLTWYQIAVPVLVLFGALLGGYLRVLQISKKPDANETIALAENA